MKKKGIVQQIAEQDLLEASLWYESKVPALGKDFLSEINQVFIKLSAAQETHPFYYKNFRKIMPRRFPYKIFYRIEHDEGIVFRVLHAKKDHPRFLKLN